MRVHGEFRRIIVEFPGTKNRGMRPLEGWELKPEGVIKASFELTEPQTLTQYEITFSEAESPDRGYKLISNKVSGEFPRNDQQEESSEEKSPATPQ